MVGETREWVESQVAHLLDSVGARGDVKSIKCQGKRPACAKLEITYASEETWAGKRLRQKRIIDLIRTAAWIPRDMKKAIWVVPDRTPEQRLVGRCFGKLGGFLEDVMGFDRAQLEVDSWQAARSYIGRKRITGTYPGRYPTKPPASEQLIRWPVVDDRTNLCIWVDLEAMAEALGKDVKTVVGAWDSHFQV